MNKKLVSFLVLGVFAFTLIMPAGRVLAESTSVSIDDLQKQISQLLELIKNLQSQLNNLRGQTQPVTPVMPEQCWEKVSGMLSSQNLSGATIYMWGTHQIGPIVGGSQSYYLVKAVNNDVLEQLKKYERQNVTLWGQLQYQNLEGGFWGFTAKKVYLEGYGCAIPAKVKIGYKGDDVKIVQQYLATDSSIYPEGLVTGYYGPLTKKALEKFQEKNGLNKTGEFDEDTKKELEIEIESHETIRCIPRPIPIPTPTPIPNQGFKVYSPSTGETWIPGQTYKIACNQIWPTIAPTMTGSANTSFAPIGAVRTTLHKYISCLYDNPQVACLMAEPMPYVISEKTDNDGIFEWTIPDDIAAQYQGKVIINVSASDGGFSGNSGVFTIGKGTSGQNLPPVVSGVSGPTSLKSGETGTWTVKAYDPENGSLSYSVLWGDEAVVTPYAGVAPKEMSVQNTATFTHVYNSA